MSRGITLAVRSTLMPAALLLLFVAGCEHNLCTRGTRGDGKLDQCVPGNVEPVASAEAGEDAGEIPEEQPDADAGGSDDADVGANDGSVARDAAHTPDAGEGGLNAAPMIPMELDAQTHADSAKPPMDAQLDASEAQVNDASLSDVSSVEAGEDARAVCEPASLSRFRTFQISPAMIDAAVACGGSLAGCLEPGCEVARCIRAQAGVDRCEACVESEGRCVAQQCATDCGPTGTPDACRACACFARCFDRGGGCGLEPVNICRGCSHESCTVVPLTTTAGAWQPQEEVRTGNLSALQPVAISRALDSVETFWLNDDGSLGYMANDPSRRKVFATPGPSLAAPAGVFLMNGSLAVGFWRSTRIDVVARSSDDRLWHRALSGPPGLATWSEWDSPPNAEQLLSGDRLGVTARGPLLRDAFFAGKDGHIHHVSFSGGASLVSDLGAPPGIRLRGPHATARAIDILDVVARGDDGRLYYTRFENGSWTPWENPRGIVMSGLPQVVSSNSGLTHVYWQETRAGGGGNLGVCAWNGSGWQPVTYPTHPDAVSILGEVPNFYSFTPGRVDGAARTNANGALSCTMIGTNWYWSWNMGLFDLGPHPVSMVSPRSNDTMLIFGTTDGSLGANTWFNVQ